MRLHACVWTAGGRWAEAASGFGACGEAWEWLEKKSALPTIEHANRAGGSVHALDAGTLGSEVAFC